MMSFAGRSDDDEARRAMAAKLDKDLDAFLEVELEKTRLRRLENPEPESSVEELLEEMSTHPAFLTEIDYTKPLHPATEALIAMQYDTDNDLERAEKYKADGNDNFKRKRYRWAIDNYTEGITTNCADRLTNAILYSNRAAANFHLGNLRSSLNDVIIARKFQPDHLKAIVRGAQCCHKLSRLDDCLQWCHAGLIIDGEHKLLIDLKDTCSKLKTVQERNRRKQQNADRKLAEEETKLREAIAKRDIRIHAPNDPDTSLAQPDLTCHHPGGQPVHLSPDGSLVWPVLFLYPEHSQTDFIQAMDEGDRFCDHIDAMFGPESHPAEWDTPHHYTTQHIQLYFKNEAADRLERLDTKCTLLGALQHQQYELFGGTPTFILLSTASHFYQQYLDRKMDK